MPGLRCFLLWILNRYQKHRKGSYNHDKTINYWPEGFKELKN